MVWEIGIYADISLEKRCCLNDPTEADAENKRFGWKLDDCGVKEFAIVVALSLACRPVKDRVAMLD